jgi:hypothetical protein
MEAIEDGQAPARIRPRHEIMCKIGARVVGGDRDPLMKVILPELQILLLPCWIAMHRGLRSSVRIRRVAYFLQESLKRYCERRPLSEPALNSAALARPAIRQTTTRSTETAT